MVSIGRLFIALFSLTVPIMSFAADYCEGIVIRQSASPRARPGEELEYQIVVHHSGSCPVDQFEITDYLPQDAEWIGAIPAADEVPGRGDDGNTPWPVNRVRWLGQSLSPGGTSVFVMKIRVPEMKTGWMRNTACFRGANISRRCADIETFVRRD